METFDALIEERGDRDNIWASMIKQALTRRKPGFNESFYGYRSFTDLLKGAEEAGLIELRPDEKSGSYLVKAVG